MRGARLGRLWRPGLGGMAGAIRSRLPFWIAAGLSLAKAPVRLYLVLPDHLPIAAEGAARAFAWRGAPIRSAPLKMLTLDYHLRALGDRQFLSNLAACEPAQT